MTEPLAPTTIGERQAIAEREARQVCVDYRLSPEAYERSGGKHPLQSYIEEAILRAFAALLPPTTNAPVAAQREAVTDALLLSHARIRCALEMIAAGHGCPMALAVDVLKNCAAPQTLPIHGEMREALIASLRSLFVRGPIIDDPSREEVLWNEAIDTAIAVVQAALARNALQGDGL